MTMQKSPQTSASHNFYSTQEDATKVQLSALSCTEDLPSVCVVAKTTGAVAFIVTKPAKMARHIRWLRLS